MKEDEEEEFTDEQFLAWIKAYSDDVEEAMRKYKIEQENAIAAEKCVSKI